MLRLTVDPKTLYLNTKWTFYIHVHSVSLTFATSFLKAAEVYTVADFWCLMNNISCKDLHSNLLMFEGKRVTTFSFFKEDITPEWEHSINYQGCEWGCREELTDKTFEKLFIGLTLKCVNSEFNNVVGIRCINKSNKLRDLFKIEIWMEMSTEEEINFVKQNIDELCQQYETSLLFTLLSHKEKQDKAIDFFKKKYRLQKKIKLKINSI